MAVILFSGGFPGQHPLTLSPQNYWDFTDASKLWQDTGRTSQITADGQTVKGVTDQGSQLNHLSEATNGPTYRTGPSPVLSGYPVCEWDGTNDQLTGSSVAPFGSRSDSVTIMAVLLAQTSAAETGAPAVGKASYMHYFMHGTSTTTVNPNLESIVRTTGTASYVRKAYTLNNWAVYTGITVGNGQADPSWTGTAYSGVTDTRAASLATVTCGAGNIGALAAAVPCIGSISGSVFWDGYMAEMVVFRPQITEDQRKSIEWYWGAKYGLTIPY